MHTFSLSECTYYCRGEVLVACNEAPPPPPPLPAPPPLGTTTPPTDSLHANFPSTGALGEPRGRQGWEGLGGGGGTERDEKESVRAIYLVKVFKWNKINSSGKVLGLEEVADRCENNLFGSIAGGWVGLRKN
ncbi:hypothetical protein V1478_000655 [Vespula squamosa]|uniref:Uncharacterized protein n=1 Tax=Vespula squamosa TaxID=30214 RepID=A0ABD2C641_VESSQ